MWSVWFRSADYVDPGLVYWERKEKEEKKASEDKLMELSLPSTSSDITPSADKRKGNGLGWALS